MVTLNSGRSNGGQPSERPADTPTTLPLGTAFLKDEWTLWTSPFRGSSYKSHTVKKYGIPFGLLSAALIATDTKTADLLPNNSVQTTWSGRVSQIGAAYTLAGFSAGTFLIGKAAGNRHAEETGWLALHAIAHTQIVVFVLKQMTNRERPLAHEGGGGFWAGGDSFPSGHSATVFSVATFSPSNTEPHRRPDHGLRNRDCRGRIATGRTTSLGVRHLCRKCHWILNRAVCIQTPPRSKSSGQPC